jgi:hypothetical protein
MHLVADEQETAFSVVLATCDELAGAGRDMSTVHPALVVAGGPPLALAAAGITKTAPAATAPSNIAIVRIT